MMGQFEELAMGPGVSSGPGQPPEAASDPGQYPRPLGPDAGAPPPPYDLHNCKPNFIRLAVNGMPNSQALKGRCKPLSFT